MYIGLDQGWSLLIDDTAWSKSCNKDYLAFIFQADADTGRNGALLEAGAGSARLTDLAALAAIAVIAEEG